jgi:hypothetical protein
MKIVVSNKLHSKFLIVLSKTEVKKIIKFIDLVYDEMYHFNTKNDKLSKREIKSIINASPEYDLLNFKDIYEVDFAICRSFTIRKYIESKVFQLNGFETNENKKSFVSNNLSYSWIANLNLYEIKDSKDKIFGYYNHLTRSIVFKNNNDFKFYIDEINLLKSINSNEILNFEENYVRVIGVYDKLSGSKMYWIYNEEFNDNIFAFKHLNKSNEDIFFMKRYEINQVLASEYLSMVNIVIDFDFNSKLYYFETINALELEYNIKDLR